MKVMKTIEIPAKKEQVTDRYTCELCDAQKSGHGHWPPAQTYDVNQTTIEMEKGTNYPEGGSTTKWELDICPACFENKLIPWFLSQGGEIRKYESDW